MKTWCRRAPRQEELPARARYKDPDRAGAPISRQEVLVRRVVPLFGLPQFECRGGVGWCWAKGSEWEREVPD